MKSTLKRKLNPIIRYEGGRKFFFPIKDNVHKQLKNLFSLFYACKISDTYSHMFCLSFVKKEHFPFTEFGTMRGTGIRKEKNMTACSHLLG